MTRKSGEARSRHSEGEPSNQPEGHENQSNVPLLIRHMKSYSRIWFSKVSKLRKLAWSTFNTPNAKF
jgi:hypothetical protein